MTTARLSTKGQLIVPMEIRRRLNLHPGDEIDFFIDENNQVIMRTKTRNLDSLKGFLKKSKQKKVTLEEMEHAIKERSTRRFKQHDRS